MLVMTREEKRPGRSGGRPSFASGNVKARNRARLRLKALLRAAVALVLAAIAVSGIAAVYRAAGQNRYFTVKAISVNGATRLDPQRVRAMLMPILSGNIFTRNIETAIRFLERFPVVDHASVRLKLPDLAEVTIVERKPAAAVAVEGKLMLIDAGFHLIEEVKEAPGLLLIKGYRGAGRPGERISDPRMEDAFHAFRLFALDTADREMPLDVDLKTPETVEVHTSRGVFLRFGPDRAEWEEKFYEYLSIRALTAGMGEQFAGFDLSFKDQVVGIRDGNPPPNGGKLSRG